MQNNSYAMLVVRTCTVTYRDIHETDRNDPRLQCEICGKVLKTEKIKNIHIKMMHLKGKEHVCEICGFQVNTILEVGPIT